MLPRDYYARLLNMISYYNHDLNSCRAYYTHNIRKTHTHKHNTHTHTQTSKQTNKQTNTRKGTLERTMK